MHYLHPLKSAHHSPTWDKIELRSGKFMDVLEVNYDAAMCADVFEHVSLEREAASTSLPKRCGLES